MIDLRSVEGILFLSYLTNYNIKEIYSSIEIGDYNLFVSEYVSHKNDQNQTIRNKEFEEALSKAKLNLERLKFFNIEIIPFYSKKYPTQLNILNDKPPLLFVKGALNENKNVAIVGTRKSSSKAEKVVNEIVDFFVTNKYGIVSGLAKGIDSIAHQSAIKHSGYTIGVSPVPLDTVYPVENYYIANRIIECGGALISEIPLGLNRGKQSFVQRNRLQAAFSEYVIPIEMGINSGTMYTINFAKKQNKQILIPNPQNSLEISHYYEGIFHLIENAKINNERNVQIFNTIEELDQIVNKKSLVQGALFKQ